MKPGEKARDPLKIRRVLLFLFLGVLIVEARPLLTTAGFILGSGIQGCCDIINTGKTSGGWLGRLGDRDRAKQQEAVVALLSCGPSAASVVVEVLRSPDAYVRRAGTQVCEGLLDQCRENFRIQSCILPMPIRGRWAAERAYPRLEAAMVESLLDKDAEVRHAAARMVLKDPPDERHRRRAVSIIREALHDRDVAVRRSIPPKLCYERYGGIPTDSKDVVPLLATASHDEDAVVRRSVVEALGRSSRFAALPAVLGALNDEDEQVRTAAELNCLHLFMYGGQPTGEIRAAIRGALPFFLDRLKWRDLPAGKIPKALSAFPSYPAGQLRFTAMKALCWAGGREVVAPLIEAFKDSSPTDSSRIAALLVEVAAADDEALDTLKARMEALAPDERARLLRAIKAPPLGPSVPRRVLDQLKTSVGGQPPD